MLAEIGSKDRIPEFIKKVKNRRGPFDGVWSSRLHELRSTRRIIKKMADQAFEVTGSNPLLDMALELERIALKTSILSNADSIQTWISIRV